MQAVIAIPDLETFQSYGGAHQALMRKISGTPLLVQTIRTAVRAGVDSLIVLWPSRVPLSIWLECQNLLLDEDLNGITVVQPESFRPRQAAEWRIIATLLRDRFLWLPWNWVTHEGALPALSSGLGLPATWCFPVVIEKPAALGEKGADWNIGHWPEGIPVTSRQTARAAEQLLAARVNESLRNDSPATRPGRSAWAAAFLVRVAR